MKPEKKTAFIGIREKLISVFIIIKILPLIAIAVFAARQLDFLGSTVKKESEQILKDTREVVGSVGELATKSSIDALDRKSREAIERLTSETAADVATFLYERDNDILLAADLPLTQDSFRKFLNKRNRTVIYHTPYTLNEDESGWVPQTTQKELSDNVKPKAEDNKKDFHYRPPLVSTHDVSQPIYHEMTFIDLQGKEKIKVSMTSLLSPELLDVSKTENTFCKAENYFSRLTLLQQGEIYVSRVIGPYKPSPIIGPYTPGAAKKKDIPFEPEKAGYAGKENPVGKRFQGIVRWATPIFRDNKKIGYLTLALDHTHIMEFTDHIIPTEERFSPISDAYSGNYAFMWDNMGRNISH